MSTIIGIIGSYRINGIHDQAVTEILAGAAEAGAQTRRVFLPEVDIQFCTNCRCCTQEPGDAPGRCVFDDQMAELLDACVHADGIVLASPHNMGAVTAVYKRFIERFTPFAYWPWGTPGPKFRQGVPRKSAVIVASSAAPTFVWKLGGFTAETTLKQTAKMLNAKVVRVFRYGLVSQIEHPSLPAAQREAARNCGRQLVPR